MRKTKRPGGKKNVPPINDFPVIQRCGLFFTEDDVDNLPRLFELNSEQGMRRVVSSILDEGFDDALSFGPLLGSGATTGEVRAFLTKVARQAGQLSTTLDTVGSGADGEINCLGPETLLGNPVKVQRVSRSRGLSVSMQRWFQHVRDGLRDREATRDVFDLLPGWDVFEFLSETRNDANPDISLSDLKKRRHDRVTLELLKLVPAALFVLERAAASMHKETLTWGSPRGPRRDQTRVILSERLAHAHLVMFGRVPVTRDSIGERSGVSINWARAAIGIGAHRAPQAFPDHPEMQGRLLELARASDGALADMLQDGSDVAKRLEELRQARVIAPPGEN